MGRHATDESVAGSGPAGACSGGSLVVTEPSNAAVGGPPAHPRHPDDRREWIADGRVLPAHRLQRGDR